MEFLYCPNCGKKTGHKRALGWGTFFGGMFTLGVSTAAIPFYPKRCIVCGRKTTGNEVDPTYRGDIPVPSYEEFEIEDAAPELNDTKKCPFCAETIKLEAIKCRFCGEMFDRNEVAKQAKQLAETRKKNGLENRILCSDGACIGIIGSDGKCNVCGRSEKIDDQDSKDFQQEKFLDIKEQKPDEKKKSKINSLTVVFIIIGILFLIGLFSAPDEGLFRYLLNGGHSP